MRDGLFARHSLRDGAEVLDPVTFPEQGDSRSVRSLPKPQEGGKNQDSVRGERPEADADKAACRLGRVSYRRIRRGWHRASRGRSTRR